MAPDPYHCALVTTAPLEDPADAPTGGVDTDVVPQGGRASDQAPDAVEPTVRTRPGAARSGDGSGNNTVDNAGRSSARQLIFHPVRAWEDRGRRWLPGAWFAVAVWAIWRAVHLGIDQLLGVRGDSLFFYDGERYLAIAKQGYSFANFEMPNTAFFPGVSWLAWPVLKITRSDAWTGHIVATATAIAAFIAVWGISKAWRNERIARRAVLLMALMPSSLFLWAFYSEGLFIALGAGAVWADRKNRHWLAAALFAGLSTTRSVGILVPAVIVLARIIRARRIDRWCFGYAAAAVAGLIPVLVMMRYYTGNAFAFMGVQADWGRALSWPWETVAQGFTNLWPAPETIMVPALVSRNLDIWSLLIVAVGIGYLIVARRDGFPMEAWMLGVALVALPLCSSSLASFNRFAFATWVLYPAYASLAERLPIWWRRAFWVTVVIAFSITTYHMVGRFSVDRFVG